MLMAEIAGAVLLFTLGLLLIFSDWKHEAKRERDFCSLLRFTSQENTLETSERRERNTMEKRAR